MADEANVTPRQGKLFVAGMGPGDLPDMTGRFLAAIKESDLIVGYTTYIRLLGDLCLGKDVYTSGMRREKERAFYAVSQARLGRRVCLVSGGDAGVYGLAGLVFELLSDEDMLKLRIEVIPGVTAAVAAAARLGAPLMHDFAVISLSDLLTDATLIEKRLRLAAEGDFVTVIYNPRSSKRDELFLGLPGIFLEHRNPETPVGVVHHAGREDEKLSITSLSRLTDLAEEIHMGTTIVIGNSTTFIKGGYMITRRGYLIGKGETE